MTQKIAVRFQPLDIPRWEEVSPGCCCWIQSTYLKTKSMVLMVMGDIEPFSLLGKLMQQSGPHMGPSQCIIFVPPELTGKSLGSLK
jgi:hypothetical protein